MKKLTVFTLLGTLLVFATWMSVSAIQTNDYVDTNQNGICDHREQTIDRPMKSQNWIDENQNGICDHKEQGSFQHNGKHHTHKRGH